jgi:ribosome-binding factor A
MPPNRRGRSSHTRRYPRTARLNEVLREILAEALEHISGNDDRLELVTITGVECETDLRHAVVFYTARTEGAQQALEDHRVKLQSYVARETSLKRTPQLSFLVDAGVTSGWRIEELLKGLGSSDEDGDERGP